MNELETVKELTDKQRAVIPLIILPTANQTQMHQVKFDGYFE